MKRLVAGVFLLLLLFAAIAWWRYRGQRSREGAMPTLYGNIEIRDAQLAFNGEQKVARVLVDEGDRVTAGQLLAELDTSRLSADVAAREAAVAAQEQVVLRLTNGTRPEEIEQARSTVKVAEARLANATLTLERTEATAKIGAVSRQDLDDAIAAADSARAELTSAQATLRLAEIGPREEDIAEAKAQLSRLRAEVQLAKTRLADARLFAPGTGFIRTRVIEVGEMVNPTQPALTLALTDQKWVRAYVAEPDLGRVKPGMSANVFSDSFPDQAYSGWVGHISPQAEFTPKSVQTEELRSALVYEVRVYVRDPQDQLRLGMPVTIRLDEQTPATHPSTNSLRGDGGN